MPGPLRSTGLAVIAACVFMVAGCGRTEKVGSSGTLQLGLTEYRLTPQNARLSAGVLTIVVHNYGVLTHNLVVSSDGQTVDSTQPIWPGQTAELSLSLAPGDYTMASTIQSDQALGEYGTLTVTP
jgi:hypothetical protein